MEERILSIVETEFGLTGNLLPLGADQDLNYKLETAQGNFLVKITRDPHQWARVNAQNKLLSSLNSAQFPMPLAGFKNKFLADFQHNEQILPLRVFPFIEGAFLANVKPPLAFYTDFGAFLAELDQHLSGYRDPVLEVYSHSWDPQKVQELSDQTGIISDPEIRRIVKYFLMKHREEVAPILHRLPQQLIHGDANDYNVIVEGKREKGGKAEGFSLKGLIDFGDMVYAARIQEVSIALTYALMDADQPLETAAALVRGYHSILPLSKTEIELLYYLIPARLATSLIHSSVNYQKDPTNEYHQISAAPAERLIRSWLRINPLLFTNRMLSACGWADPIDPDEIKAETRHKIQVRHQYLSKSQSISYREPIQMSGSALQYMYAADGRTYIDGVNNIPHVGHCHPDVVEAGQRQMAKLNTNTRYVYDSLNEYAEMLLATFPDSLSKVFFVNSGSAATDLAVRLAKAHTGHDEFIVLDHAYHGNTTSAINLSPYKFNRKGGQGQPPKTHIINLTKSPSPSVPQSLSTPVPESPIFIAESIPGCAGQIVLDPEFMKEQVRKIHEVGGLYIADEVQTGFGRVGKHFWGFELYDVVPDMVILGKPIANGHPMGAVVCTEAVAASFETGMEFFSSFGGNPVSCEIAKAVLKVIKDEGLQEKAWEIGEFLLERFSEIQRKTLSDGLRYTVYGLRQAETGDRKPETLNRIPNTDFAVTFISDVRGSGLFLGIELVKDLSTLEPDPEAASSLVNYMKDRGILLSTDGPDENVIKFKPPMCFSRENAEEVVVGIWEWGMGNGDLGLGTRGLGD